MHPLHRRIPRRRALRYAASAAAAAAALTALPSCGEGESDEPRQPQSGGTLRFATTLPLSFGLDPQVEQATGLAIIPKVYGYPFYVDPASGELVLDHAETLERPDDTTYVIQLRDRRFHNLPPADGRAVTSDDVVMSMRRYRDNPLVARKWWHTTMLTAEGAPDPRTVIITTARPYVWSALEMGLVNAGAILPREVVEQQIDIRTSGAGSGPFQIETVNTDRVRIRRFDAYGGEPAYLDGMEWRIVPNANEAANALRDRSVDIMSVSTTEQADDIARSDIDHVIEPGLSWATIGLRVDRPPFNDLRVRQALDLLLDRGAIAEAADLEDAPPAGPISANLHGGQWSLPPDEFPQATGGDDRREQAQQLLAAAGLDQLSFTLQTSDAPELADLARIIQAYLKAQRVTVRVETQPAVASFVDFRSGQFQAALIVHPPYEAPDESLRLYHSAGQDGAGNPFGFSDAALDALIERSWGEREETTRAETIREAQRAALEARPMLHLFGADAHWLVRDYVHDAMLHLPGSASRRWHRQWLALPVDDRPD